MKCFGSHDKGRKFHCKIVLLDETELIQEFYESSKGQDLLDIVHKHLNLLETAYFGLRFIDSSSQNRWLDSDKSVIRQTRNLVQFTFYFAVKFYASDPSKLLEEITRYQFFLQIKQDILQSRLPVPHDWLAHLFAYAVQSELGDYDPRRHQPGYISEFCFVPNQTPQLEAGVAELHKSLAGQVPATAELNFLEKVKWIDLYGADLHPVLGEDTIEYFLALTPTGILVLRNKSKVASYLWPRIVKMHRKDKYFMIRVVEKNKENNTYGFELPSKQACKHLWKCCTEHHAFFKLTQNNDQTYHRFGGFASRFRYSGRKGSFRKNSFNRGYSGPRDRPPSAIVRVSSRRFQRLTGTFTSEAADNKDFALQNDEYSRGSAQIILPSRRHVSQSVLCRSTSVPNAITVGDSPKSAQSAPWENPYQKGLFSSSGNVSPRSISNTEASNYQTSQVASKNQSSISRGRNSSCSNHRSSRQYRSSDNESEVSRCSRSSRHSHHSVRSFNSRHHRSHHHKCKSRRSGDESESESVSSTGRHRRRRTNCSSKIDYGMVDSEQQWKQIQQQQQRFNAGTLIADIRGGVAHTTNTTQYNQRLTSGYLNSIIQGADDIGLCQGNEHQVKQCLENARRGLVSQDIKKHIDFSLVPPDKEDKHTIKYTKIESENSRLFKIRYSPDSGRALYKIGRVPQVQSNDYTSVDGKKNSDLSSIAINQSSKGSMMSQPFYENHFEAMSLYPSYPDQNSSYVLQNNQFVIAPTSEENPPISNSEHGSHLDPQISEPNRHPYFNGLSYSTSIHVNSGKNDLVDGLVETQVSNCMDQIPSSTMLNSQIPSKTMPLMGSDSRKMVDCETDFPSRIKMQLYEMSTEL